MDLQSTTDQCLAALKARHSALVVGLAGTGAVIDLAAAQALDGRTRVLHVRPPLDLAGFIGQAAQAGQGLAGTPAEQGFLALTATDAACSHVALFVDGAHLMSPEALHYLALVMRVGAPLQVVLAGPPVLDGVLAPEGFRTLRDRLPLRFNLPLPCMGLPSPASAAPRRAAAWAGIGVAASILLGTWTTDRPGLLAVQAVAAGPDVSPRPAAPEPAEAPISVMPAAVDLPVVSDAPTAVVADDPQPPPVVPQQATEAPLAADPAPVVVQQGQVAVTPVAEPVPPPEAAVAGDDTAAALPAPPPAPAPVSAEPVALPPPTVFRPMRRPDPVPEPAMAEAPPPSAPPLAAQVAPAAAAGMAGLMIRRAEALWLQGDVSAARLLYERAAAAGSGAAAAALGSTFDPAFLQQAGVVGLRPDRAQAAAWYARALALGNDDARMMLQSLQRDAGTTKPERRP